VREAPAARLDAQGASPAARLLRVSVVFVLLLAAYVLTFSNDSGDALDTARWMREGRIERMVEFRHLIVRLLPYWLWQGLGAAGLPVEPLNLLRWWDFFTAALSPMLFYHVLYRLLHGHPARRGTALAGSALYATAHCVWIYAGSGRLYSSSMLLVLAAYLLALRLPEVQGASRRWWTVLSAGALVCFAGLFWLVQVFNAVGVGLLIALLPERASRARRAAHLTGFALSGLLLAGAMGVSCLRYAQVPLEGAAVQAWIADTRTPPTRFDSSSFMKAAYGQAHGILGLPNLSYMINGLLRDDRHLLAIGSLPWQLGKFIFIWLLLLLAYAYPFFLFWNADRRLRVLILALAAPLAINIYFALIWLGTDRQRFMPSLLSVIALGTLSTGDLLKRFPRPRWVALALGAAVLLVALVNYFEVLRPTQARFRRLAAEWASAHSFLTPGDLLVTFGRDVNYHALMLAYGTAPYLTLTNDETYYQWDQPDWQVRFHAAVREAWQRGGRVFVMDRIAFGVNPVSAAWSEKQHPRPTVREFAAFLRSAYCVTLGFRVGQFEYFELNWRAQPCPPRALSARLEAEPPSEAPR